MFHLDALGPVASRYRVVGRVVSLDGGRSRAGLNVVLATQFLLSAIGLVACDSAPSGVADVAPKLPRKATATRAEAQTEGVGLVVPSWVCVAAPSVPCQEQTRAVETARDALGPGVSAIVVVMAYRPVNGATSLLSQSHDEVEVTVGSEHRA